MHLPIVDHSRHNYQVSDVPGIMKQGRRTPWLYLMDESIKTGTISNASQGRACPAPTEIMPCLFDFSISPALVMVLAFLVYPALNTLFLSFRNAGGLNLANQACVVGQQCQGILENYRFVFTSNIMLQAFINNLSWICSMVPGCVLIGLLIALLADRDAMCR